MPLPSPPCRRGLCLVISAPSGAGKSTLTRALRMDDPFLTLSVSTTTRAPRAGEQEGIHYFFRSQADFDQMVACGDMLEHATVFDRSYGTPRVPVTSALNAGHDVLFDIDWQGYRQLRAALPGDVVGIFVLPPSLAALESRLTGRGDAHDAIAARMQKARDEISHWDEFDYLLVNDDLAAALAELKAILTAARAERARRPDRAALARQLLS